MHERDGSPRSDGSSPAPAADAPADHAAVLAWCSRHGVRLDDSRHDGAVVVTATYRGWSVWARLPDDEPTTREDTIVFLVRELRRVMSSRGVLTPSNAGTVPEARRTRRPPAR